MSTQILAGRFELGKQLSQTEFSSVYLGYDRQQLEPSSCVITAIRYRQPEMCHRLERGAQLMEQLGCSPQVPSVLAYFSQAASQSSSATSPTHSTFYIVRSHILGHPLNQELTPAKRLSEGYVAKLLQDVLAALSSVHQQQQVHQNLHPQNLIRQDCDGQIFITEFGELARLARSEVGEDGTLRPITPVSPQPYLAPEQLQPDYASHPSPASDLYALGLIAIEALTGQPHYNFSYDPNKGLLWREGVEVSLFLAEFIDRLVRHLPEDRFADATSALETLRLGRDRDQIANDSRLNTMVAAPGGGNVRAVATGGRRRTSLTTAFTSSPASITSASAARSTTSQSYRLSVSNPRLFKWLAGGLAVAIALGVSVKAFQWGQHRLSQLPQTWETWRAQSTSTYPEAQPNQLTPLLEDGSILARPAAAQAFWNMVVAASEGDVSLYPLAGYRPNSSAVQDLVETVEDDYPTGYAIAIGGAQESQDWQVSFAGSDAFRWLRANAKDYGFELSVSDGPLGQGSSEPWHWRYVGDEDSRALFEASES